MPESFYVADRDLLVPTELTLGPWAAGAQHGGPPSALAARAIERLGSREDWRLARVAVEILSPVPLEPLEVRARIVRPGLNVEMLEASITVAGGRDVLRATAWRMRTADLAIPAPDGLAAPPGPDEAQPGAFFEGAPAIGYQTGVELRFLEGGFNEPGPAKAWLRMRKPLVAGEEPSPLQRVLVAADAGNGLSSVLDHRDYLYINTDLTVQLFRPFEGPWVYMDSTTFLAPDGIGLTETVLADHRGRAGRASQTLFVRRRTG